MRHVICDLDGVLWRGRTRIAGADEALRRLDEAGVELTFATNNSTRTPAQVAEKIRDVTGYPADPSSVGTSSLAAATLLDGRDSPSMVVGGHGIVDALTGSGISLTPEPLEARSVVVGLTREFDYRQMADASHAIRNGARFIATNDDPTFPTDTGFDPGSGAIVASIERASGVRPEVAGKPNPAMVQMLLNRGIDRAWVIGDRMDTDIALAAKVPDWTSVLVLTGVSSVEESPGADHVVADISAAVDLVLSATNGS